ncbi:MAG: HlyD family efflux transporter periplasmic adaptor subunit [Firmicutes bacterium]|nr:HlyD family efflux transporter periplasmic adaptor subunit [Bacillota bacterium]
MKSKKAIKWIAILLVLAAAGYFGYTKFFGNKSGGGTKSAATDFVSVGSITSKVEGSGLTKAKDSETLTLSTAGTVLDVFVQEGDMVTAGQQLFTIDSPSAETQYQRAKTALEEARKSLNKAYEAQRGLNFTAPFAGKIIDCNKNISVGDDFMGGSLGTLVDDRTLVATLYYSYAYENSFSVGQSVNVSIPSLMSTLTGKVTKINKVSRVTPEGSKLFSVDISVSNPGVLTKDMEITASFTDASGEQVYPYESAKLEYSRVKELVPTATGKVTYVNLVDYMDVSQGQPILRMSADDNNTQIYNAQEQVEKCEKDLENAQKNLDLCKATAPIDGKIIGLTISPGQEVQQGSSLVTISDTSTIVINATVDERNISYIKPGMPVELNQWGNMASGTVDSISLNSTINNGVATYPIVISADNSGGNIQVNSYIQYNLTASQADNCLVVPLQAVKSETLADGTAASVVYVKASSEPENMAELMNENPDIPKGFYPVQVELGISDNYNVQILSGVEEGTEVFTQMITDNYWG